MTAVLAYLRDLSVAEWVGIAAASWLIVGSLVALPFGGMIRRADDTERAQYPPPVPAPRPRESDLDWLLDQPDEVWLTNDVVNERISDLEARWAA